MYCIENIKPERDTMFLKLNLFISVKVKDKLYFENLFQAKGIEISLKNICNSIGLSICNVNLNSDFCMLYVKVVHFN